MKTVKTSISENYQTYLISRLSDPNYAAIYLETHFEETPPDPELLQLALNNVAEALLSQTPERSVAHRQQLNEWLTQPGGMAIQDLAKWLNELGLKLTVRVDSSENDSHSVRDSSLGEISGNVTNTIHQLQNSDRPHASELADLLKQLQVAINTETHLSEDDKALALEQTQSLAEAAKAPQDGKLKKSAKLAIGFFNGIVTALPTTATLVEAVNTLLPTIASLLGL